MIYVDVKDRKPIWEQLVENIKTLVVCGAMCPDEQLPSVRALAAELAINPNTIQKAYAELERSGVVYSIPGRGSFVTSQPDRVTELHRKQLLRETEEMLKKAKSHGITKELILLTITEIWGES